MLILRPYQTEAVDALWSGLADHDGNLLAVLPTGTGKALVICEFVRRAMQAFPDTRILVLTHSRELVSQNHAEMMGLWPGCPAGIYAAGLRRREIGARVIFGSIQSLHTKAVDLQHVDLVIVDEAQSIPRNSDTMWRRFLGQLTEINPHLRVLGLTATAFRLDSGMLHKGEGALFSRIVYEYSIVDAINAGYLAQPISAAGSAQIDTSAVGTRGGEFIAGQLEAAASDPETVDAIADEIVAKAGDRRGWIVFGCGVKHCTMLRDALRLRGVTSEGVFATTPLPERDAHIAAFKAQRIRALVSVTALAVGFNAKHVDLVALARPTQSAGLFIQAVGRGTRLYEGKADCLVLDFGGNLARHGPVDKPNVKAAGGDGEGAAPTKKCPVCEFPNLIAARVCSECGSEFPAGGSKLHAKAAAAAVLSSQIKPEWVDVASVQYREHRKEGKPPSVAVSYGCGLVMHREWACPEHVGYARTKFEKWWMQRAGTRPPRNTAEALSRVTELRKPAAIQVRPVGKFTEIVAARFA